MKPVEQKQGNYSGQTRGGLAARILLSVLLLALTGACSSSPIEPTDANGLTAKQNAALQSLQQVDDYPLYTMKYEGKINETAFNQDGAASLAMAASRAPLAWGCSLFAAMGNPKDMLFGRNFDWHYSPALLLFTSPPDGYASVSMVDMVYLGFTDDAMSDMTHQPLDITMKLLDATELPFDGMNSRGLVVGMAAVPRQETNIDPQKPTIESLMILRKILDHAKNVDEALELFEKYNLDWGSAPTLHYLIADTSGKAVLVEFYDGKMVVIPNTSPWHVATNFVVAPVKDSPQGNCPRYDRVSQQLSESGGKLPEPEAMSLLESVSTDELGGTQWSVIYRMNSGDVSVVMKREYTNIYRFVLPR